MAEHGAGEKLINHLPKIDLTSCLHGLADKLERFAGQSGRTQPARAGGAARATAGRLDAAQGPGSFSINSPAW